MQPVTASCVGADGKTQSASITPGIDLATLESMVIQGMAQKHMVLTLTPQQIQELHLQGN
jgi:flagellar biogenesis protein FliO